MKIYEIVAQSNTFWSLLWAVENPLELTKQFDGRSLIKDWQPIPVHLDRNGRCGDFFSLKYHIPVVSSSAHTLLRPLISDFVEFLPLQNNSLELFAVNVIELLDCLDETKSKIRYFSSSDRIMHVEEYAFKDKVIGKQPIFKMKTIPRMNVLVTEQLKEFVELHELEGWRFRFIGDASH